MKGCLLIRHMFVVVVLLFFVKQIIAQDTYFCTATKLNIRENASTTSEIIGHCFLNQEVTVLEICDGWALVNVEGQRGYVNTEYISQNQSPIKNSENKREDKEGALIALVLGFFFFVTLVLVPIRKLKRKIKSFKKDVKDSGFVEAFMSRAEDWVDNAKYK